jgi:hypothetical protein
MTAPAPPEARTTDPRWPLVLALAVAALAVVYGLGTTYGWPSPLGGSPRPARASLGGEPFILCSEPGASGLYLLSERKKCNQAGAVSIGVQAPDSRAPQVLWAIVGDSTELIGALPTDPEARAVISLGPLSPTPHTLAIVLADRPVSPLDLQNAFSLDIDLPPTHESRVARLEKFANKLRAAGAIATVRAVDFTVTPAP